MSDLEQDGQSRGLRHVLKINRWEVVSSSDKFLVGRWLSTQDAKRCLKDAFYPDGTVTLIHPDRRYVRVDGGRLLDCDSLGQLKDGQQL
jgi:hypothetical protein